MLVILAGERERFPDNSDSIILGIRNHPVCMFLIYLFRHVQGSFRGVRFMLDIVIVGITVMTVGWEYFIKPELNGLANEALWGKLWVDMLYPLCATVLIFHPGIVF